MSFATTAILGCAATVILGVAATHPLELQGHRWWRIGLSLPWVVLLASVFAELEAISGYFALWGVAVLGFLWAGPMAHGLTLGLQRLLYGNLNRALGVCANFAGAKALLRHGDFEEALRLTKDELEKEPLSYEGLVLLAQIHVDLHQEGNAIAALSTLLGNPQLTVEQRRCVDEQRKELIRRSFLNAVDSR